MPFLEFGWFLILSVYVEEVDQTVLKKKFAVAKKKVAVAKKKVAVANTDTVNFFLRTQRNDFVLTGSACKSSDNAERCGTN